MSGLAETASWADLERVGLRVGTIRSEGELTADSRLTGVFVQDETAADADGVLMAVEDAREEALRREFGRES